MKKGLIDPHTRTVWVPKTPTRKWWTRKLFSHGGGLCLRVPPELMEYLGLTKEDYVMIKVEKVGVSFTKLYAATPALEKEEQ